MEKYFFHASFIPKIVEKVDIARKRLIAASPEQFFWILQLIAHQKWYCLNFLKTVYYFYYINIVIRFFWRK